MNEHLWSDDDLAFLKDEPAVQVRTISMDDPAPSPATKQGFAPPSASPGYVACPKSGAYYARHILKRLGAYWDPDVKLWFVPVKHQDAAFEACREGATKNAELVAEEVARLLRDADALMQATTVRDRCWECGEPLHEAPKNVAGAAWDRTSPVLKVGAVVDEAYCGCVERGDAKRRHRPNFSRPAKPSSRRRW